MQPTCTAPAARCFEVQSFFEKVRNNAKIFSYFLKNEVESLGFGLVRLCSSCRESLSSGDVFLYYLDFGL
ncbi:MAG: hypothetical protein AAF630_17565 [Cyanobacteria bacterium P01_C01_bin.38]